MAKKTSSTVTLSFNNPFDALFETVASIKDTTFTLFEDLASATSSRQDRIKMNKIFSGSSLPKLPKFNFNKKSAMQIVVPIVVVLVLGFMIFSITKKSPSSSVSGVATSSSTEVKTFPINREFSFPLVDEKGKIIGKFTYTVKSAELRHQIIIKGERASAVSGRVFLIFNLQINNTLNQGLQINTRDYIRVSVNGDDKQLLAPDIHNDPVEAQAISVTNTRVGIAINETDRNLKLLVGEIGGKKATIPLTFN